MPTRPEWWNEIRWFKPEEFDSPDEPGSGALYMKQSIVEIVDDIRHELGEPLKITSGYRTAAHNAKVGGKRSSAHLRGCAVDIAVPTSDLRFGIVNLALAQSIYRIGIAKTFVHIDTDPDLPQDVMWLY